MSNLKTVPAQPSIFATLTSLMLDTANNSIPQKNFSPHKQQGWNEEIHQVQHAVQQELWRAAGKPPKLRSPYAQPLQITERKIPVNTMPAQKGIIRQS